MISRLKIKSYLLQPKIIFVLYALYGLIEIFRSSFVMDNLRYFVLFDDMMVSMRYAKHLAQGHGLIWNITGERVEGFSNLLWTLYMSFLHLLPHTPQTISLYVQITGLLIMILNLFLVHKILNFFTKDRMIIFFTLGITAFYFPLNNWGFILGTEVGVLTLIVTVCTYLTLRSIKNQRINFLIYILLGTATLVRMDALVPGIIIVFALALGLKKHKFKTFMIGTIVLGLFVITQEIFRILYYGEFLPNTYYLKIYGYSPFWRIVRGIYVLSNLMNWLLILPIAVYMFFTRNKYLLIFSALFLGQVVYSVYVGGDAWETMGGSNRYITIVMPIFFCLFALSCQGIYKYLTKVTKKFSQAKAFALYIVFLVISFFSFSTMGENMLTQTLLVTPPATKHENKNQVLLAHSISKITLENAKVGIVWAGITPYFAEREYVDLLGKNDKHIARGQAKLFYNPPRFLEHVRLIWPGHNKWDYNYAVMQKPDIFVQTFPGSEEIENKIIKNGYYKKIDNFTYYIKIDSNKIIKAE